MRKFLNLLLVLGLIVFTTKPVKASDAESNVKEVEKFVNTFGNEIIKITSNKKNNPTKRRDQMIGLVDSLIDSEWITKFVLGKNYKIISQEQKDKFKKLYREFMINTYGPKFERFNGKEFKIKSISDQNNYYLAKCLFYPDSSEPLINIDFRVKKQSSLNKYFVIDVIAEGVSLIETQRSEFNSTISSKGVEQFIIDLESRVKKLKSDNSRPGEIKSKK